MPPFAPPPRQSQSSDAPKLVKFVPFDPATKMSEATATDPSGGTQRVVKGAFAVVIAPRRSRRRPRRPRRRELEAQGLPGPGGRRRAAGRR